MWYDNNAWRECSNLGRNILNIKGKPYNKHKTEPQGRRKDFFQGGGALGEFSKHLCKELKVVKYFFPWKKGNNIFLLKF